MRTQLVVSIAVGLLPTACDSSDTGPAPKPISEKQSSGGSDGGSGGGGSGGDGGSGSDGSSGGDGGPPSTIAPDVLASCGEMCDHTVSLSTDCPDDAATQCKALCKLVLANFDAQCQQTAKAWYICMKTHTEAAACNSGNVPAATAPAECESETTAYSECLQQ
ncbi:MAG: hypothetical protein KF894_33480 [Labilithrix sp.]|nr:hypothetical protein [Labilithrix sp.]